MTPLAKKWPLAAAAFLLVVLGALMVPWFDWDKVFDAVAQFRRRPEQAVVAKPTVLLVSAEASDRYIVGNTVEPRGYALQVVGSADAGKRVLDQDREQIAVVVVDVGVPGARKLIQASRSACPRARLVELRGPRETTQVSALLVNTVLN
jgi:hypothetical protein